MNELILKKLIANNFQLFKRKEFDFGRDTTIRGKNGMGKTSVYSAFSWLLFGKDAYGRSDFDVKRLENGVKVDKANVIVEAEMLHNGEKLILRKVLEEQYSKRDDTYLGDRTIYFINNVPQKEGEYKDFISTIITEEDFKMMTQIGYFESLDTKVKRNYLSAMAGVRTPADICEDNEEWLELVRSLSGKSFAEALQERNYRLKVLTKELDGIRPSVDALETSKPEAKDWDALHAKKSGLEEELASVENQLASEDANISAIDKEKREKARKISDLNFKINGIEREIKKLEMDARFALEREVQDKNNERTKVQKEIEKKKNDLKTQKLEEKSLEIRCKRLSKELEELTEQYNAEQVKVFSFEGGICPLSALKCDSPTLAKVFESKKEEAEANFNVAKTERLESIILEGQAKKLEKDNAEKELEDKRNSISAFNIQRLEDKLLDMPHVDVDYSKIELDVTGQQKQIEELRKEIENLSASHVEVGKGETSALLERKEYLKNAISSLIDVLADKRQIENVEKQIKDLNSKAKLLASQIASLEIEVSNIKDINRAIMEDANKRINALFEYTTWRTSVLQKNGLYKDVCEPCVDGVSKSLNTAKRVNIGIDICQTIMRYRDILVPLFIDCRESVSKIIPTHTQTINLVVDASKENLELTIN